MRLNNTDITVDYENGVENSITYLRETKEVMSSKPV